MSIVRPAHRAIPRYVRIHGRRMRPLLKMAALRDGDLDIREQSPLPFPVPKHWTWVLVIRDDPPEPAASMGPTGFHAASVVAAFRAVGTVALVTWDPRSDAYLVAAELASLGVSMVIVETSPAYHVAWTAFADAAGTKSVVFYGLPDPTGRGR